MATDATHRRVWQARAERVEAAVGRVQALHERVTITNLGDLGERSWCRPCGQAWPCDTITAVNG